MSRIIGKYIIQKTLGNGGFGNVYLGQHQATGAYFAIKQSSDQKSLEKEFRILKQLQDIPEMVRVFEMANDQMSAYMVLERLGDSLNYYSSDRMSLESVCAIGYHFLILLEKIHSRGFIHRDIKPSQMLVTLDMKSIKLIDFGLAYSYLTQSKHKPFKSRCNYKGTAIYASINNHLGFRQSRRDDLESLCYSLIQLANGELPWKASPSADSFKRWKALLRQKIKVDEKILFKSLPPEFAAMLKYIKRLSYEQTPNYSYLKSLMEKFINKDCIYLHFDWYTAENKPKFQRVSQIVEGATVVTKLKREKKRKSAKNEERKILDLREQKKISFVLPEDGLEEQREEKVKKCKKIKKSKKFELAKSALDLSIKGYSERFSGSIERNRSHEENIEVISDGEKTPRYEMPEFKNREIIMSNKKSVRQESVDNNSGCTVV